MTEWWDKDENDGVATHPSLWRPLSRAMDGFDLDPAAGCEPVPIADERYTEEDDGLTSPWNGTVWLNPPFSDKGRWYHRLDSMYQQDRIDAAVAVAPAGTDADWFHESFATCDVLSLLDGRNWFHAGGSPPFATMVGVWTPTDDVVSVLNGIGTVVRTVGVDWRQNEILEY